VEKKSAKKKKKLSPAVRASEDRSDGPVPTRTKGTAQVRPSTQTVPADQNEDDVRNGSTVVFPQRAWMMSSDDVNGQHYYYDSQSSKSQWMPPVTPQTGEKPETATVVSSR
jgi:hypothetical protein